MKKLLIAALITIFALSLVACGPAEPAENTASDAPVDSAANAESDLSYVKDKGVLVVGITDFAPMDYRDESGEWIGFDADLAKEFAKTLGVDIEFSEIEWENKILELDGKSVDCVWNGMTLNDEVLSAMSCSEPYCNNQQVVIVPVEKADLYKDVDSCKELNFAVEAGSAGEDAAVENGFNVTPVKDQATALMEVASGTSDAAVIDSLMAAAMVGEGTGYDGLTYTVGLSDEEYGVGFRKNSDITEEFNKFLEEIKENGVMDSTAEKYKVQAALIK